MSINALHPLEDVLLGAVEKQADFYGRIIGYPIPDAPEILTEERYEFGQTFFCEEFDELYQARQAGDLEGQLDAYLDIAVVALGRVVEMGVCTRAALQEVMRANSSKKRGKNAKRGDSGFDAVKPPGWRPPDFRDLLEMTLDDVRTFSQMKRDFGEGAIYAQADEETVKVYPPDHLFTEDLSLPHTSAERYRELQVGGETRAGAYSPARPSMAANGFMKFDGGKVETPELIPAPFLRELATLYAKGAAKYAAENWRRGSSYQRYIGAAERHFLAWRCGEAVDGVEQGGTGVHHLVSAAWNLITLYMQETLGIGEDDRPDLPTEEALDPDALWAVIYAKIFQGGVILDDVPFAPTDEAKYSYKPD